MTLSKNERMQRENVFYTSSDSIVIGQLNFCSAERGKSFVKAVELH